MNLKNAMSTFVNIKSFNLKKNLRLYYFISKKINNLVHFCN